MWLVFILYLLRRVAHVIVVPLTLFVFLVAIAFSITRWQTQITLTSLKFWQRIDELAPLDPKVPEISLVTPTPIDTSTQIPTNTPQPTATTAETPTVTATATITDIAVQEPSATYTPSPIDTPTSLPTETETPTPPNTALPVVPILFTPILVPTDTPAPTLSTSINHSPPISPTETIVQSLPQSTFTSTLTPTLVFIPSNTPNPTMTDTPAPTLVPSVSSLNLTGHIAYTILAGNTYDIWIYRIEDGSRSRIVTGMRQPDTSSSGSIVARAETGGIIRMAIDGTNQRPITELAEDEHPHMSVGGGSLVYDAIDGFTPQRTIRHMRDINIQQNAPFLPNLRGGPTTGRYPIYLANNRIAYNGCNSWENGGSCGIYTLNDNGTDPIFISDQPGDIPTDNLLSQVLFMSRRSGNWDIFIADWNVRNNPQALTSVPTDEGLPTASPDGQHIAFLTNREGPWSIYTMRVDGSEQRKLFDLNGIYGTGDRDWTQERISWGP